PIAGTLLAQDNFGPLRSGFSTVLGLSVVDVFGQQMTLATDPHKTDGPLRAIPSQSLAPSPDDPANREKIFLPPRVLTPTRLWFKWLSASHENKVGGGSTDFVEMNSHPSTSPVFGWIVPNHLTNSLFFYDAGGAAIGYFGIEHGQLVYRTRAGNLTNPSDLLEKDIGSRGIPLVNPHLAAFMWTVKGRSAEFLIDLMTTTERAECFINPGNFAQNASLAMLIGRPLALTRVVVGLETEGGVLPVSQASLKTDNAFPQDVANGRFEYGEREKTSSAALSDVQFPLRLGNLANFDDGLVGFLIDQPEGDFPDTFFSQAAPANGSHGIVRPDPTTIKLTLNANPNTLTLLVDPRAPVHATTGILPVETIRIPQDQYEGTLRSLEITFFIQSLLRRRQGLVVPLPNIAGFQWSWVTSGRDSAEPLAAESGNDIAVCDFTPQTVLEGWLRLKLAENGRSSAE
ncbi:MAG: hypothetical protein KC931_15090, partial [Candidatus Omnitrophica bacterium]|nr:hypothetical protein [Candidatus Omnitrophota bacterium]